MRAPPLLQNLEQISDAEAAELAARSRQEGSELVRDHLGHHVEQNPGQSSDYVSWIATLHPENAEVTVDQRFFVPGNPWWTIYEETKNNGGNIIPTATAVAVAEADEERPVPSSSSTGGVTVARPAPPFYLICSPLDAMIGFMITTLAVMAVFLCELVALTLCYMPGAMFYHLAQCFKPESICVGLFHSIFMLVYSVLALADSIVLFASVVVTESLACTAWLVSVLFGGILMANYWHQYVRRLCHGIRVISRRCNHNPPRTFIPCCGMNNNEDTELPENVQAASSPYLDEHPRSSSSSRSPTPVHHIIDEADVVIEKHTNSPRKE